MNSIDFYRLKSFSGLFLEYINEGEKLIGRFPANEDAPDKLFKEIKFPIDKREKLIQLIKKSLPSTDARREKYLKLIEKENTFCIVTAQEPGFLGGPMNSYFKAISAIVLADIYKEKYDDYNFIPLFWVEDNDHDAFEIGSAHVLDKGGNPGRYFADEYVNDQERIITGEKEFKDEIEVKIEELLNSLEKTDYSEEIKEELIKIYIPGSSWTDNFIRFMDYMLGGRSILFISANQARKAGLFKELAINEIKHPRKSDSLIEKGNDKLRQEDLFIHSKSFNVNAYLHDGKRRCRIDYDHERDEYSVDNSIIKKEELLKKAGEEPEQFSPQVLLRPLWQDMIIPAAVFIGNPSEISYMAQLRELYEYNNVKMPIIKMRLSASFIDENTKNYIKRNGLDFPELIMENRYSDNINQDEQEEIVEALRDLEDEVDKTLDDTREEIKRIKPSFDSIYEKTSQEIINKIEDMKEEIISKNPSEENKDQEEYSSILNKIYPNGALQERILSILVYANLYGRDKTAEKLYYIAKGYYKKLQKPAHVLIEGMESKFSL